MRKAVRCLIALMAAGIFAPLLQAQPRRASGHAFVEGAYYASHRHRRNSRHRRQLRRNHLRRGLSLHELRRHRSRRHRLRRHRLQRFRPGFHFDLRRHRRHPRSGFHFHFGYRDY